MDGYDRPICNATATFFIKDFLFMIKVTDLAMHGPTCIE